MELEKEIGSLKDQLEEKKALVNQVSVPTNFRQWVGIVELITNHIVKLLNYWRIDIRHKF